MTGFLRRVVCFLLCILLFAQGALAYTTLEKGDKSDEVLAMHDRVHWDFVQIQLNYLDWRYASGNNVNADYLYAELEKRHIPAVIMEPLLGVAQEDQAEDRVGELRGLQAGVGPELVCCRPQAGFELVEVEGHFC